MIETVAQHRHSCLTSSLQELIALAEMGGRWAKIDMGRKVGEAAVPLPWGRRWVPI